MIHIGDVAGLRSGAKLRKNQEVFTQLDESSDDIHDLT
jgi:hypothetical protein